MEDYIENEDKSRIKGLGIFPLYAKRDMFHRYNSMILGEFDGMKLIGFKAQFSHSYGDNTKEFFYHVTRGCAETIFLAHIQLVLFYCLIHYL